LQVQLHNNTAGNLLPEGAAVTQLPAEVQKQGAEGPATACSLEPLQPEALNPLMSLQSFELATISGITATSNTASMVLDVNRFDLLAPLEDVVVSNNRASGIRLMNTRPNFNGQGITIKNTTVSYNKLMSPEVNASQCAKSFSI
jgi:hypothetical protein